MAAGWCLGPHIDALALPMTDVVFNAEDLLDYLDFSLNFVCTKIGEAPLPLKFVTELGECPLSGLRLLRREGH